MVSLQISHTGQRSIYKRPQLYRKQKCSHNTKSIGLVLTIHFKERYKTCMSATRYRTGH